MPQVKTSLGFRDHLGSARARAGMARNQYKVNPGLYCTGTPASDSPVFVTANYKLSFDSLRRELAGLDAWILVVDTRGINVWCAAGKGTFSADEIALQVKRTGLARIVSHRELILPQFAAVGVAAYKLKKKCGFIGIFGPLRAKDIRNFMRNDKQADETMRSVTFTFAERLVLVPVEILLIWKMVALVTVISCIVSAIGPDIFSLQAAWRRGLAVGGATLGAVLAGALLTPALLPWIPGRQLWLKGAIAGVATGVLYVLTVIGELQSMEKLSIVLWITGAASYLAMNFTGATPYTSLSGVEKEMRRGLPVQCLSVLASLLLWAAAPFMN